VDSSFTSHVDTRVLCPIFFRLNPYTHIFPHSPGPPSLVFTSDRLHPSGDARLHRMGRRVYLCPSIFLAVRFWYALGLVISSIPPGWVQTRTCRSCAHCLGSTLLVSIRLFLPRASHPRLPRHDPSLLDRFLSRPSRRRREACLVFSRYPRRVVCSSFPAVFCHCSLRLYLLSVFLQALYVLTLSLFSVGVWA